MTQNTMKNTQTVLAGERTQFTAGPWIENLDETTERINAVIGLDGQVVCDNVYGDGKDEAAANMRLICCAPELLEALKEAAAILRPLVHAMNIRSHFHEKNVLANTIEKAITKAEGN